MNYAGGYMKYCIDLHIHSALSPCADDDMTPNNIVNMSLLKGLDIIAVTDHNSTKNCAAVIQCAAGSRLLVVPGMELETKEEVHVLCLFAELKQAAVLQKIVDAALPEWANREDIFGRQFVFNEKDELIACEKKMLLTAVQINLTDVVQIVNKLGGVVIPAHIDRDANSIISNLGIIPQELNFKYLELSQANFKEKKLGSRSYLNRYRFLTSSDAHSLGHILEADKFIELAEYSVPCLIKALKGT